MIWFFTIMFSLLICINLKFVSFVDEKINYNYIIVIFHTVYNILVVVICLVFEIPVINILIPLIILLIGYIFIFKLYKPVINWLKYLLTDIEE